MLFMGTQAAMEAEGEPVPFEPALETEPVKAPSVDPADERVGGRARFPSAPILSLFLLAMAFFLHFAKAFFLPLVLAILLSFWLTPVVKWLTRLRLPQALSSALVLLVLMTALGNGVNQLARPARDFVARLPESLRELKVKMHQLLWHAEQLTQAAAQVQDMTKSNPPDQAPAPAPGPRTNLGDVVFSATTSFVTGALETIVLLYFLLAYGDLFLQKLMKVLPNFHEKKKAAVVVQDVQQHISSFLFTITLINLCLGVLVGVGVWAVGLGNAVLWGVAAALLNYIPCFGPIVGVSVFALAGLLTFDSVGRALVPPLVYLALHGLETNFVTPTVLGARLTLNPVVIFISLMFWTWVWGIPGALLSVPLLMIRKTLCDHLKSLACLGEFLSG